MDTIPLKLQASVNWGNGMIKNGQRLWVCVGRSDYYMQVCMSTHPVQGLVFIDSKYLVGITVMKINPRVRVVFRPLTDTVRVN